MNIGALKAIGEVWPSAKMVLGQVTCVAREIYLSRKSAVDVGLWNDLTNEEVMRSMIEDSNVMDSFQSME